MIQAIQYKAVSVSIMIINSISAVQLKIKECVRRPCRCCQASLSFRLPHSEHLCQPNPSHTVLTNYSHQPQTLMLPQARYTTQVVY